MIDRMCMKIQCKSPCFIDKGADPQRSNRGCASHRMLKQNHCSNNGFFNIDIIYASYVDHMLRSYVHVYNTFTEGFRVRWTWSCVLCEVCIKSKALANDRDQGTYHDKNHGIWERDRATPVSHSWLMKNMEKLLPSLCCLRERERETLNSFGLAKSTWPHLRSNLGSNCVYALIAGGN